MDSVPISSGTVIAEKYELAKLVAQGGMGAVWEARHLSTHRRCAVKLLSSPELSQHPEIVRRFFREARASSVIESDYIVDVFDSGVDPRSGHPYMVMELLDGEDLEKTIKRVAPIDPWVAAKLLLQASIGLAKAHELGVFHRDIKPANLFVSRRDGGEVVLKILDFGVAKVRVESALDESGSLTRTGSLLGTPLYMSPEQTRGASHIDARSDVWSLGVVFFEMLSGSLPFARAGSFGELMVAILTADLPLLQDFAPWVPPELAELTHRAMSRDITKRFAGAGELRDALAAHLPGGGRLREDELVGVSEAQRARVAPRLSLPYDAMLRGTPPEWLAQTTLEARPRSPASVIGMAGGLGVLAALATGGLLQLGQSDASDAVKAPSAAATAARPGPPPPAAQSVDPRIDGRGLALPQRSFALTVPPDAEVHVDGKRVPVENGSVQIGGPIGGTRNVKLRRGDTSSSTLIAITDQGLVPGRIELARAAPVAPRQRDVTARAPVPQGQAGSASRPPVARDAVDRRLREGTSEFDP